MSGIDIYGFNREVYVFGKYPQGANGELRALRWILLNPEYARKNGQGLFLTEQIIDVVRYYDDYEEAKKWPKGENDYWKRSNIGYFLNGSSWKYGTPKRTSSAKRVDFMYDRPGCFTKEEQNAMLDEGQGKLFLLSVDDVTKEGEIKKTLGGGATYAPERRAVATEWLPRGGGKYTEDGCYAWVYSETDKDTTLPVNGKKAGCSYWWLRSPVASSGCAAFVYHGGFVYADGNFVDYNIGGARVALWLNL